MNRDPNHQHDSDHEHHPGRSRARWALWIGVAVVALVALGYGAILFYANVINDPAEELTGADLDARLAGGDGAATDVEGTWTVAEGSELGYRVKEILFGVDTEGVGRTEQVTGSLTITDTAVTEVDVEVDMASIESDDARRDRQFRGNIMAVEEFPTSRFVLTEPIELGQIPAPGEQVTATATGDLTLRGVTNPVTFEVTAQLDGDQIGVLGAIPVVFADYEIPNPSRAGISTDDEGLLEFVLIFAR